MISELHSFTSVPSVHFLLDSVISVSNLQYSVSEMKPDLLFFLHSDRLDTSSRDGLAPRR